jgi:hypothetical protein
MRGICADELSLSIYNSSSKQPESRPRRNGNQPTVRVYVVSHTFCKTSKDCRYNQRVSTSWAVKAKYSLHTDLVCDRQSPGTSIRLPHLGIGTVRVCRNSASSSNGKRREQSCITTQLVWGGVACYCRMAATLQSRVKSCFIDICNGKITNAAI